ncbi:hypothetical protein TGPRC2_304755 [Toxoplasma gondii TgCatPRC2]|uniref:Uncharacterized protein n=3 Tax=Toxoplasma gondii TaxID=5811 RepID=A0A151H406_TOXGO|nr:hypothetical protein TGME49_304755 [Toxoplasma gondii ME49]EPT29891.1 hypothetical protein TGME49_304755 [Toxoplasma gondii ME49]KYF44547.1 hypothetical protein TGARI_304755 [Toxoplasma gondii ARI]KYK64077.1 hypothetical protein TGPRC2_304755 [Toxoplasma gondii TgCatPRC2]|eukprot:XP_018637233.1 hypothetical protein TGME49_304755 [Toxoplasma gondii ME49]
MACQTEGTARKCFSRGRTKVSSQFLPSAEPPQGADAIKTKKRFSVRSALFGFHGNGDSEAASRARSIPHAANSGDVIKNRIPRPYACVCPPLRAKAIVTKHPCRKKLANLATAACENEPQPLTAPVSLPPFPHHLSTVSRQKDSRSSLSH